MTSVSNTTVFNGLNNTFLVNRFNYTDYNMRPEQIYNNNTDNFINNGPVLVIKKPDKKFAGKKSKIAGNKKPMREVRKKDGGGHAGGGGHETHVIHEHDHGHEHESHDKGCVIKYVKGGGKYKGGSKDDEKKKFFVPMMIGLVTAKAILLPIVLKTLAIWSAKGLMLGLIATVMASILSLRKMMEPTVKIEGKKDDVTKIEVVPLPIREKIHHYPKHHYVDLTEDSLNNHHSFQGYD